MSEKRTAARTRVAVALDGSAAAATALPAARAIARQLGADIEVLHVSARPIAESTLRRRLKLDTPSLKKTPVCGCVGEAPACILRHSEEPGVELVVLTTHGRAIRQGRALGHVASATIGATTKPILLVRPEAAARRARPFKRLLFPLDGTPTTALALKDAVLLAGRLGASLDVLYVVAERTKRPHERGSMAVPKYVDQPQYEWGDWASEVMERLCRNCAGIPLDIPIRVHLRQGEVGAEIARLAAEYRHDAIVLVRRSHLEPGRAHALRAVLQETPCPILLVGCPSEEPSAHVQPTGPAAISREKFDAVILDMDGVVTRTATIHAEAWQRVFDQYLKKRAARGDDRYQPFDVEDDYRRYVDGKPRYDGVTSFLSARGISLPFGDPSDSPRRETICGLGNKKDRYFLRLLKERGVSAYDSTVQLLQRLRRLGMKVGMFSASKHAENVLAAAGIAGLFDTRVDGALAEELGLPGKPDPAMLLETARRLAAFPKRTVVIEDAIAGVQAGRAGQFGLVIGVIREGELGDLQRNGADIEVRDLSQVSVAGGALA